MARKWSVRLLTLAALSTAIGCRAHPTPDVMTPLLPGDVVPGTPIDPLAAKTKAAPPTIVTASPTKPPLLAPGAQLPKPGDIGPNPPLKFITPPIKPPVELNPLIAGPDLQAPILPPKDVAPLLTAQPKPAVIPYEMGTLPPPKLAIKPMLVEPPRPPAGPDGFAPAPIIPPPSPAETYPTPKIINSPPVPTLPMRPGQVFGHAPDYRWIAGVLDRHTKGGYWTLRFADFGSDDEWGGKMRLLDDPRLNNFKDGDRVFIEGELLAPRAAASVDGTSYPPYRINEVRMVEKGK
jgi:hypothetical protein